MPSPVFERFRKKPQRCLFTAVAPFLAAAPERQPRAHGGGHRQLKKRNVNITTSLSAAAKQGGAGG